MSMIMTFNVAQEIENAEIDMLSSRLALLQAISGNPMQIQMKNFGSATAFSSKIITGPAFNTVKGITYTNTDAIDEIISYYESLQIPCRFEITPAQGTAELFQYLSKKVFINLASIPLYIVYRKKIHPLFLLTFQCAN